MEKNFNIATIIFAYMQGIATKEQKLELQKWLDESSEHLKLHKQLCTSSSFRKKREIYYRFDTYYNYKALHKFIHRKRILIWRYVATIALILSSSIFVILYYNFIEKNNPILTETYILPPGKAIATLILADGKEKRLDEKTFQLTIENHQIVNQQNRLRYESQSSLKTDTIETYHEIQVPRGGEYQVTLSDGTHVWLNAESSIRYPIEFKGSQRKVWIQGELYFQVAQDSVHPFIVKRDNLAVQVLGTEFNIRTYPDETDIITTLVKGKVQVNTKNGESYILNPSQQLIYSYQGTKTKLKEVNPTLYISWKDGIYMFKKQRLEDIMNVISRWYNVTVSFQNQEVKEITFSGRLKRYEQAQTLLRIFEKLRGVKFTVVGNHIIVEKQGGDQNYN